MARVVEQPGVILRHGEHVEVVAPEELRAEVAGQLRAALEPYSRGLTE